MKAAFMLVAATFALAACGEKPQSLQPPKQDASAFQGTGMPFAAPGWKQGDKTSWEQQLKTRAQNGQNDYAKVN
ncbi:MAG: hypothetical protein HYX47_20505 [Burkholderiales bacterium]|nr:hypothetical protein [Burkholderiales bacterium]